MRYRKRPVVVEAVRWTGTNVSEIRDMFDFGVAFSDDRVVIATLEGVMVAEPGDWIIRGIAHEAYPCKNAIFEATYELVLEDR